MKGRKLVPVLGAIIVVMAALATGARAQTAPAPPSEAEAYAAQVQLGGSQVAAVGHAQTQTGEAPDTAHAGALEIGPEPPPAEQFGGTQEGPGDASGGLIETAGTGFDELGRLAVLPWSASVSEDATGRHARAHSGLLEVLLAPGGTRILELRVLTADAASNYTPLKSTANSSSDGVVLILGDPATPESLTIRILHSEASSESGSSTFLLEIAGQRLVTNDDDLGGALAQICGAINIPGLLQLVCVSAAGGAAEFAQAIIGDGASGGGVADLFNAQIAGGAGGDAGGAGGNGGGGATAVLGAAAAPDTSGQAGALPATGMALGGLAAGIAMLGSAFFVFPRYRALRAGLR